MDTNSVNFAPTFESESLALPKIKTTRPTRHLKRQFEVNITLAMLVGVFTFAIAASVGFVNFTDACFYSLGMGTMFVLSIQARQNSRFSGTTS